MAPIAILPPTKELSSLTTNLTPGIPVVPDGPAFATPPLPETIMSPATPTTPMTPTAPRPTFGSRLFAFLLGALGGPMAIVLLERRARRERGQA